MENVKAMGVVYLDVRLYQLVFSIIELMLKNVGLLFATYRVVAQ